MSAAASWAWTVGLAATFSMGWGVGRARVLGWGTGLVLLAHGVLGCGRAPPTPSPPASARAAVASARTPPRRCPPEMVLAGAICVDRWEAQLVEAKSRRAHSPFRRLKRGMEYRAVSRPGVKPQGYISRIDASAACRAASKRLCSAREWLTACQGSEPGFDWRGRCNLGKGHVMTAVFGTSVVLTYDNHYNSPRLNQEPGYLAETGEYGDCVNEYGLHDMVGNLHEWVADDVGVRLKREIPIPYDDSKLGARGNGVFMGGYFSAQGEHGDGCNYVTTSHRPDYHDYSTGFRCCADPRSL